MDVVCLPENLHLINEITSTRGRLTGFSKLNENLLIACPNFDTDFTGYKPCVPTILISNCLPWQQMFRTVQIRTVQIFRHPD